MTQNLYQPSMDLIIFLMCLKMRIKINGIWKVSHSNNIFVNNQRGDSNNYNSCYKIEEINEYLVQTPKC